MTHNIRQNVGSQHLIDEQESCNSMALTWYNILKHHRSKFLVWSNSNPHYNAWITPSIPLLNNNNIYIYFPNYQNNSPLREASDDQSQNGFGICCCLKIGSSNSQGFPDSKHIPKLRSTTYNFWLGKSFILYLKWKKVCKLTGFIECCCIGLTVIVLIKPPKPISS